MGYYLKLDLKKVLEKHTNIIKKTMSSPEYTPYLDSLTEAMQLTMEDEKTIFIGQQIVYYGNPMSKTIEGLPKERMIETPVMEETQMGMTMGLAMTGHQVVTFYPRWDFVILAVNQLVNHLDKLEVMSDGEWKPNVIVRVGKGSDTPLDPGHQHKADYTDAFKQMVTNCTIEKLDTADKILPAYKKALSEGGIHILVEYPELYYKN
jgi:pyruvate/2-oxoglutarate/acetoin dehydrogenase E1 component|tara:strand:- start:1053 stop:1670 length:618 start_codon:yes stop_codon:yes gene_type:complete